jgi:predicted negative regulator of RcsB-dependent stress response
VAEKNNHAVAASDMYMQVAQYVIVNGVDEKVADLNTQMVNNFSDTPYAAITSLIISKKEYESGNLEQAITQLEWVYQHAGTEEIKQVAALRLSRILLEQKKYDAALTYLNATHDAAFDAVYEELKGDVYVAKGQISHARLAYDKAIKLKDNAGKWLELKRRDLGNVAVAESSAT